MKKYQCVISKYNHNYCNKIQVLNIETDAILFESEKHLKETLQNRTKLPEGSIDATVTFDGMDIVEIKPRLFDYADLVDRKLYIQWAIGKDGYIDFSDYNFTIFDRDANQLRFIPEEWIWALNEKQFNPTALLDELTCEQEQDLKEYYDWLEYNEDFVKAQTIDFNKVESAKTAELPITEFYLLLGNGLDKKALPKIDISMR